jgi:hypothetical protein
VGIITGAGSGAVDDVRAQLREAEADLTLDVVRVPMSRPCVRKRRARRSWR